MDLSSFLILYWYYYFNVVMYYRCICIFYKKKVRQYEYFLTIFVSFFEARFSRVRTLKLLKVFFNSHNYIH